MVYPQIITLNNGSSEPFEEKMDGMILMDNVTKYQTSRVYESIIMNTIIDGRKKSYIPMYIFYKTITKLYI